MARRKLLLFLKPFDVYQVTQSNAVPRFTNPRIFHYIDNRRKVHKEAINVCQKILQQKPIDWKPIYRNILSEPIHDVDLVVTIGGDGTLLQASHFLDDSIPVLGVNSDPTQAEEVEKFSNEFDATRSTGYLCAATVKNFEHVLDGFLEGQIAPSKLTRISVSVNSKPLSACALNDILIAHPCPATVSRFSFKIRGNDQTCSPLVNCRSSGLRISTAAGSTAAMLSAGGFSMPILSRDLQYMVREPISSGAANSSLMHGLIKSDQSMDAAWFSKEGFIYFDGSHVFYPIQSGDAIEISSKAPILQVVLPHLSS
ncbi:ARABIDOPSIS THALIANA NADH KINASE 3, NAD(H) kinase 3 [Hibiscus trionum]|uniref:ARABIDOPSIS THALIANA NADH KINASE 3, NAD(H) kinase 3 n=1 Tax=Hibiscus trionum TaxID=183268 RepID=A0A9W7J284_HIBTR|nr:ARABIDOPSIS THALIANA NADH KINASE 3, NAD(H) kinase 3 [Hibiscus trionum]